MSKRFKMFLMIAVAGSMIGSTTLAEAGKTRSTVERRQRPGQGFWDTSHKSKAHQHRSTHQGWNLFQCFGLQKSYRPATPTSGKSWGWQRGSRTEFYHPAPRRSGGQ